MGRKLLLLVLASSFFLIGCPKPANTAYQTAVGAKAFLDSVKKAHPECTTPANPVPKVCSLLTQATAAKDLLIDAGEFFCGGKGFETGLIACSPPDKKTGAYQIALDKLNAAVSTYQQFAKDLQGVL